MSTPKHEIEEELLHAAPRQTRWRSGLSRLEWYLTLAVCGFSGILAIWSIVEVTSLTIPVFTGSHPRPRDGDLIFCWCFTLVVTGLYLCLVLSSRNRFKKTRRLITHGRPAMAIITDKRMESGDSNRYFLRYRFQPKEDSSEWMESERKVERNEYYAVQIGDQFTVLYMDNQMDQNELYQHLSMRAGDSQGVLLRPAGADSTDDHSLFLRPREEYQALDQNAGCPIENRIE
jgi:hypothetical protein